MTARTDYYRGARAADVIVAATVTRDETIQAVRTALRRRSGKAWSVTGGRGTGWGWIHVDAPPARRTWHYVETGARDADGMPVYEERPGDTGGHMSPAERAELAGLLGLDAAHFQGVSIPANSEYYREYVARAEGLSPTVRGSPYWD